MICFKQRGISYVYVNNINVHETAIKFSKNFNLKLFIFVI